MGRSLLTYSLSDLYDLETQATDLLRTCAGAQADRMLDVLAAIKGEIADRVGQTNLAACVCGYEDDGSLLDAKRHHTFARVR